MTIDTPDLFPAEPKDAETLVRLAIEMRNHQRAYFSTRDPGALNSSKICERVFDREAAVWVRSKAGERS